MGDRAGLRRMFFQASVVMVGLFILVGQGFAISQVSPLLTMEEREWISAHPQISLAPDPKYHPIEFLDDSGQYLGIAADYVALLEKRLGLHFRIVRPEDWDEALAKAGSRQIDMFGAAAETPSRLEYMLFTEPYLELPAVIIVNQNVTAGLTLDKLKGMKVAVVSGYAVHDYLALHAPQLRLEPAPDVSTGLRKVSFGLVDAFVGNLASATYFIEKEGITNLRIAGESGYVSRLSLASRSDWPELHHILEKGLASIGSAERKAIYHKWIHLEPENLLASKRFWQTLIGVLAAAMLAIGGVVVWNRALKTQVEQKTRELVASEERYRSLFENAVEGRDKIDAIFRAVADGLVVSDMNNRVVLMNKVAEQLSGVTLAEALSHPFDTLFAENELGLQVASVLAGENTGPPVEWDELLPASGHPRTIQALSSRVLTREGTITGAITLLRDVTRERELDRMKNEFISTAAHELRTPLTAVMGFAELLLNKEEYGLTDPARQNELLSCIHQKAQRLEVIISDLLDLSRIQSGQVLSLKKAPCDIGALITRVVSHYQKRVKQHHFLISLPDETVELLVDGAKIEQVLENLLSNAVKFSPTKGTIKIAGQVTTEHFLVSVEDEGIGMSPEQVEKVFDKFYRVDASDTAKEGLGLGMSIAKTIVEAHGGNILVESVLNKGTLVRFTVPL